LTDHKLRSLQEVRRLLPNYDKGWKALLNELTAIELATGEKFVDRQKRRRYWRYRVSLAAIEDFAPHLLGKPKTRQVQGLEIRKFEEALGVLDEKISNEARAEVRRSCEPRFLALSKRLANIERAAGKSP
jgi:hypothetical protein